MVRPPSLWMEACTNGTEPLRRRISDAFKRLLEFGETLGDAGKGVVLAFELERDVTVVVVAAEELGDTAVVEIERVPKAAAEVGLHLHEAGFRRELFQPVVRVFQEV